MAKKIRKAFEMTDAKISYVSLVNKAANKKRFIITKAEKGNASFQTYGRIIKTNPEAHYVTGIVYEPMSEDTDGNYMTEEEITKAAHWFAKNGTGVDLQHNFERLDGATVVESSVAKCDMEIEGQPIKKGTWLMTVEITDESVYEAIEKGELTGFSMGGVGLYSSEDVNISDPVEKNEKRGILKALAEFLGLPDEDAEPIKKGAVMDKYITRSTSENFWDAFYALQDVLMKWDYQDDRYVFCGNKDVVEEALADFNSIVTDLLVKPDGVWKCVSEQPITKAGKSLSAKNLETLKSIHESLGSFLATNNSEQEEKEVTKEQAQAIAVEAAAAAITKAFGSLEEPKPNNTPTLEETVKKEEKSDFTQEAIDEMVAKAVAKAMGTEESPTEPEAPSFEEMVAKAVDKAMQPYFEQSTVSSQLNGEGITKSEEVHYLHGII